jgi:hypothetical protein
MFDDTGGCKNEAVTMRSLTLSWTWAFGCMERLQLQRLRPNAVVSLGGAILADRCWYMLVDVEKMGLMTVEMT